MTEISLKQWVHDEAERTGLKPASIYNRLNKGKYPGLKLRKVNKRIIWVRK